MKRSYGANVGKLRDDNAWCPILSMSIGLFAVGIFFFFIKSCTWLNINITRGSQVTGKLYEQNNWIQTLKHTYADKLKLFTSIYRLIVRN